MNKSSKNNAHDKTKYAIFYLSDIDSKTCRPTKNITQKFYAKNDEDAFKYLKKYRTIANKAYTYYYGELIKVGITGKNGKVTYKEGFDHMSMLDLEDKNIFEKIGTNIRYYWSKLVDVKYWFKYLWYYIRTGHDYKASWSLDYHLLNEIKWNLDILKKNTHGCSTLWLDKARTELHKSEKDFDIAKYNESTNYSYTDEEWKLAEKYREEEYDKMIEYINLYDYYSNHGILDKDFPNKEEFEKKWKHTLPIKPGTYDSFDYKKLQALENKYWNKIWEWIREYGRILWD